MNVYCLYFPNGKRYVGVESEPMRRIRDHSKMRTLRNERPAVVHLAVAKHGWANVRWRYLAVDFDDETAWKLERFFIAHFKTQDRAFGYNLSSGGRAGTKGTTTSDATKKKLSAAMKSIEGATRFQRGHPTWNRGRSWSADARQKLSETAKGRTVWNKGKPCTWSWNKGVPCSAETRAKISSTKRAKQLLAA